MPTWLMTIFILLLIMSGIGIYKKFYATAGLLAGVGLGLVIGFRAASLEFSRLLPPSSELSEARENDVFVFGIFFLLLVAAATLLHALEMRRNRQS